MIAAVSFAMSWFAARGADQAWNPDGPTNNWNATDLNWDAGDAWTQANNAIFGGSGETVTLTEGIDASGLTFNSSGYTISGNTLTLAADSIIDTGANSAMIASILAGGPISKAGSGILTLSGTNAYSGSTTINADTLQPASAAALPAGTAVNLKPALVLVTMCLSISAAGRSGVSWTARSSAWPGQIRHLSSPQVRQGRRQPQHRRLRTEKRSLGPRAVDLTNVDRCWRRCENPPCFEHLPFLEKRTCVFKIQP